MGKKRTLIMGANAEAVRGVASVAGAAHTLDVDYTNMLLRVSHATAATVTIPADIDQSFEIGDFVEIQQAGAGTVTVNAAGGVTLRNGLAAAKPVAQWAIIRVIKVAQNEWSLSGNAG